jgi:molecular chaperone GrpE
MLQAGEDAVEDESTAPVGALKRELTEEKRRNEELLTRLKYAQADLENYRKRMDKEVREASDSQVRSLALKLLVVQDELDLARKHAAGVQDGGEVGEGIAMVRKNLQSALESAGVERIEAVGKPFDPSVHEAVEKVHGEGPDRVVGEVRAGFTFRGQLLRPSMVKVELGSKKPEEAKQSE